MKLRFSLGGLALLLLASINLRAQTLFWNGLSSTDGSILAGANWVGGVAPTGSGSEFLEFDDLPVGGPTPQNNVLFNSPLTVITIQVFGSGSANYTFSGPSTVTLNGDLLIGPGNPVSFSSSVTFSLPNGFHTVDVGSSADTVTFSGVFTGAGSVHKDGGGELFLTGANTYAGGTTINLGTITLSGGSISHPGGGFTVADAGSDVGTLNVSNGTIDSAVGVLANQAGAQGNASLAGNTTAWNVSGNLAVGRGGTGALNLSAGAQVASGSGTVADFAGSVGNVSIVGSGSKWLAGAAITIGNNGSGTVSVTNNGTLDVAGGSGTINLAQFAGATGALQIGAGGGPGGVINANTITSGSGSGSITFNTNGTFSTPYYLTKNGTSGGAGVAITGTTSIINTAGYNVLVGSGTNTGNTTINTSSTLQLGVGGTSGSIGGNVNDNGTLAFDRSNAYAFGGTVSGTGNLTQIGTGTLTLTAVNSYTGATGVSSGTLAVSNLANGGTNSSIGASTSAPANLVLNGILLYNGPTALTDRLFTIGTAGGEIDNSGSGVLSLTNSGTIALAGANTARTFTLGGSLAVSNLFDPVLTDNGAGATSLVKNGNSSWQLIGANTYTGSTTINAGTLYAANVSGSATGSGLVTISAAGTLDIGNSGTFGAVAGSIVDNGTLTFSRGNALTYGGSITGTGVVNIINGGAITLANTNNYSGATNVQAGSLADTASAASFASSSQVNLSNSTSLTVNHNETIGGLQGPASATVSLGGGGLTINSNNTTTYAGAITGTGSLDTSGVGFFQLTGSSTFNGAFNVHQGLVQLSTGSGSMNTNSDVTVAKANGENSEFDVYTGAQATFVNANIGFSSGSSGVISLDGAGTNWITSGTLYVGEAGTGMFSVYDGASATTNSASIGNNAGGNGTLTVDGLGGASHFTNINTLYIGSQGVGHFNVQNNATAVSGAASIGNNAGGQGVAAVNTGGTWNNTASLLIGDATSGTLTVTTGGQVFTSDSFLGVLAGSLGSVSIDGNGSKLANAASLNVGVAANGQLTVTNQALLTDVTAILAANASVNGTVQVDGAGSTWTNTADITVGKAGTGTFNLSNGASASDANATLGALAGSTGHVLITAGGSNWTNSSTLIVGGSGSGLLTVTGGGSASAATTTISANTGGSGTVTVTGTGSVLNTSMLTSAAAANGTLNILAGGTVADTSATVGANAGVTGLVFVDGSTTAWNNSASLTLGDSGFANLIVSNLAKVSDGSGIGTILLGNAAGASGTINIGALAGNSPAPGGIIDAGAITTGNGSGSVLFRTTATAASPYYFTNDATSGGGAVLIHGTASVGNSAGYNVLTGNNDYTGITTITGGTLVAGSTGALGTSSVQLLNGATLNVASGVILSNPISFVTGGTLAGNGTIASSGVTIGSNVTLSPGNSPGTITFSNGLTLGSGGTFSFEVQTAGGGPGTGFDLVNVSGGALTITSTSASPFFVKLVSLDASGNAGAVTDFNSSTNYSWTIAVAPGGITNFAANKFVLDTSAFSNPLGTGSFSLTQGLTGGNPSLIINFAAVPEPSTYALLLLGVATVGCAWRKKLQA